MDDKQIISDLIARERQYRVTQKTDELEKCYWPDATVTTSWTDKDVPIQAYLHGGKAPVHDPEFPIISRLGTLIVHQNGKRAYVETPQTTIRWVMVNGEKAVLTYYIRLMYKVEKRDGEWRICDNRGIYEGDELAPEIPGTDLKLDLEELKKYRHSVRYLSYCDGNVSQELPGIDRPEQVKAMYEALDKWIME